LASSRESAVGIIRRHVEGVAASDGLEVFDVSFRREAPGWVLRVMLDYKAPDAVSEYWAFVETHRVAPDVDFERYAEALLAEATA